MSDPVRTVAASVLPVKEGPQLCQRCAQHLLKMIDALDPDVLRDELESARRRDLGVADAQAGAPPACDYMSGYASVKPCCCHEGKHAEWCSSRAAPSSTFNPIQTDGLAEKLYEKWRSRDGRVWCPAWDAVEPQRRILWEDLAATARSAMMCSIANGFEILLKLSAGNVEPGIQFVIDSLRRSAA